MTGLLSNAGRAILLALASSIFVLAPGFLAAPNLNSAILLASGLLVALGDGLLKALQVLTDVRTPWPVLDAFIRPVISALVVFLPGVYMAPDLNAAKAAGVALMIGVANAILRTGQAIATSSETITGRPVPAGKSTGFDIADRAPAVPVAPG